MSKSVEGGGSALKERRSKSSESRLLKPSVKIPRITVTELIVATAVTTVIVAGINLILPEPLAEAEGLFGSLVGGVKDGVAAGVVGLFSDRRK